MPINGAPFFKNMGVRNLNFDYLKGVYVLRKLALLNSSSILDIGESVAGKEVPVDIHGLDTHGVRVFAGDVSTKNIAMYHNDSDGYLVTSSGRFIATSANGGRLRLGDTVGRSESIVIGTGHQLVPVSVATGSAPAGITGGIYYDTTLNKLCVYTGAGYETITSS